MILNSRFFDDNYLFQNYGVEHGITVLLWTLLGAFYVITSIRYLDRTSQRQSLLFLGIITAASQLGKILIKVHLGIFDYTIDLPLHLCNMLPFIVTAAILTHRRLVWAVCFFWIMAGTFQALISPTLDHSYPHYEYHRYWIVHCGLVIIALYPVFVWKWKVFFSDAIIAMMALNILGLLMYGIDILLDANYMYMRGWPPGKTIYNLLGKWPIYHYSLEGVMILIFGLLLLPFMIERRRSSMH